jgi:hypothetical protein
VEWHRSMQLRLPQRIFERLQHLFVFFDCSESVGPRTYLYSDQDVSFAPFEALVELKTLQIVMVVQQAYPRQPCHLAIRDKDRRVLCQMIRQVSTSVQVTYRVVEGSEQHEYVESVLRGRNGARCEAEDNMTVHIKAEDLVAAGIIFQDLVRSA